MKHREYKKNIYNMRWTDRRIKIAGTDKILERQKKMSTEIWKFL